jgi:hypothetical protein
MEKQKQQDNSMTQPFFERLSDTEEIKTINERLDKLEQKLVETTVILDIILDALEKVANMLQQHQESK